MYQDGRQLKKKKKHLVDNEYRIAICADTKIIHFIEIVEGRDKPLEESDSQKQFEGEKNLNIIALVASLYFYVSMIWTELLVLIWALITYLLW